MAVPLSHVPFQQGAHSPSHLARDTGETIPACAGSTGGPAASCTRRRDHPRMGGEHAHVREDPAPA